MIFELASYVKDYDEYGIQAAIKLDANGDWELSTWQGLQNR
jgi:hypothetical protein